MKIPLAPPTRRRRWPSVFFTEFKAKNWESVYSLYSEDFLKELDRQTYEKMLTNMYAETGPMKECKLKNWKQLFKAGMSGNGAFVSLVYDCKHEKYDSTISFNIRRPLTGGKMEILGQNFNSIGFLLE